MDIQYLIRQILLDTPGLTEHQLIEAVQYSIMPTQHEVLNHIYALKIYNKIEDVDGRFYRVIAVPSKEVIDETKDKESLDISKDQSKDLSFF